MFTKARIRHNFKCSNRVSIRNRAIEAVFLRKIGSRLNYFQSVNITEVLRGYKLLAQFAPWEFSHGGKGLQWRAFVVWDLSNSFGRLIRAFFMPAQLCTAD